jgi:predicted transcriptional regulator
MIEVRAADSTDEQDFLRCVSELCAAAPALAPLPAAVLIALSFGVSRDSRSFSKTLGVEHALVLRAVTELADAGLVTVVDRNARTQRTQFALTDAARSILDGAGIGDGL